MKTNSFLSAALIAISLTFFACSSYDGGSLPSVSSSSFEDSSSSFEELSSSSYEPQGYCVYISLQMCFPASSESCSGEGILLPICPYSSSSSLGDDLSSSSELLISSSSEISSSGNSSSSGYEVQGYCVYTSLQMCFPASSESCLGEGILVPSCPYSSSSSLDDDLSSSSELLISSSSEISSSSSNLPSSSSSEESSSSCTAADNDGTQYCSNGTMKDYGSFTYSGQTYKTVEIGNQIWMAENLNYNVSGSACYSNSDANCATYGRLYNWATAMNLDASCNSSTCSSQVGSKHRGICPSGWHIPSNEDWTKLFRYVDGSTGTSDLYDSPTAGGYLKATSGWNSNGNGTDSYGFAALPGGYGDSDGSFNNVGNYGHWWSASEIKASNANSRYMYYFSEGAYFDNSYKSILFSVRCLQN